MKQFSDRIQLERTNESLKVIIKAYNEKWKEAILMAWVAAWTFCGIYFLIELYQNQENRSFAIFLGIMIGFWLYFEIRVVKALLWRLFGKEIISLSPNGFEYKSDIKGMGKLQKISFANLKKFDDYDPSTKSFFAFMGRSYWIIGGESIEIKNAAREFIFARELSDYEIKHLVPLFNRALDDFRRKKK
jgi:hypothetical protein